MPAKGTSFGFSVRFIKNPTRKLRVVLRVVVFLRGWISACNVLFQSTEDIYTLRNYGKRSNCSLSTLFPAAVRVASLNVGIVPSLGRGIELETGTIHKVRSQVVHARLDIRLSFIIKKKLRKSLGKVLLEFNGRGSTGKPTQIF